MSALPAKHQPGETQRRLLRCLLQVPQGRTVEDLCNVLGVTHNAVRQHLTALLAAGFVERGEARPSGGRPRAVYALLPAGRELFPRNYALVAGSMLEHLYAHEGAPTVQAMLTEMGAKLGATAAQRIHDSNDPQAVAEALAEQLDALGYEAQALHRDERGEVEAWNCVFHALAKAHPDVCRFDIAFMQAATGRKIQHTACMLRGSPACRFRIGAPLPPSD
ncbi:MAG TPA: helix-turn-helix domain-containing protein [Rhodanobacteraceae bacterium]|nr:helix-turn-helix domain-containing protein [Rhodanobacteraceae bacterium]